MTIFQLRESLQVSCSFNALSLLTLGRYRDLRISRPSRNLWQPARDLGRPLLEILRILPEIFSSLAITYQTFGQHAIFLGKPDSPSGQDVGSMLLAACQQDSDVDGLLAKNAFKPQQEKNIPQYPEDGIKDENKAAEGDSRASGQRSVRRGASDRFRNFRVHSPTFLLALFLIFFPAVSFACFLAFLVHLLPFLTAETIISKNLPACVPDWYQSVALW